MIGGNVKARLEARTTERNEIGESISNWVLAKELMGYIDLTTGDSRYQSYDSKIAESTHVFICDYFPLDGICAHDTRLTVEGEQYDVMLIDNPMGLKRQVEIYLKHIGE